jgi:hypothetical protein
MLPEMPAPQRRQSRTAATFQQVHRSHVLAATHCDRQTDSATARVVVYERDMAILTKFGDTVERRMSPKLYKKCCVLTT